MRNADNEVRIFSAQNALPRYLCPAGLPKQVFVNTKMVGNFVENGDDNLLGHFGFGGAHAQSRPAEDPNPVWFRIAKEVAVRERDPLVKSEQILP